MFTEGLGRLYDIGWGWSPVDLATAGATGKRLAMSAGTGITFVVALAAAGSGTEDIVLDLQQHTAYTGGTTADLDATAVTTANAPDHYYLKSETTLDNDESWVKVSPGNSPPTSEITIAGASYSTKECLVAIEVGADSLGDGYTHVSLNCADPGSAARIGVCLYLIHDLSVQRAPANLGNLLRPGAANA